MSAPALSAAPGAPRACLPADMERAEIASANLESGSTLKVCLTPGGVGHEAMSAVSVGHGSGVPVKVDLDEGPPVTVPGACLAVDLASKKLTAQAETQVVVEPTPRVRDTKWRLSSTDTDLIFCRFPFKDDTKCQHLRVPRSHPVEGGHGGETSRRLVASLSPDGQRVAVLVVERGAMVGTWSVKVDTYDRASRRRLTRTPLGSQRPEDPRAVFFDTSDFWGVEWRGEWLELRAQRCCGPDGRSVVLDPATGAIEPLGDPVFVHEVKPGVLLFDAPGASSGDSDAAPLTLTLLHLDDRRRTVLTLPAQVSPEPEGRGVVARPWRGAQWVVMHTSPPGVAWVDVERETIVDQLRLPRCE